MIKTNGCFELKSNCERNQYYYKFFNNGEILTFLNHYNYDSINFHHWGRYHIQNDTIKSQIYYSNSWIFDPVKTEQWFKVINDTTMIRFIRCYNCFDDFYTGRTISDTLQFVRWEVNSKEKYIYIVRHNWLRRMKKNWKEGTYPWDEK